MEAALDYHDKQHQAMHPILLPPYALELGCGIGAASIALSYHLLQRRRLQGNTTIRSLSPLVVATDVAPQALSLTVSNAYFNRVSTVLSTQHMNFTNVQSIDNVMANVSGDDATDANGFAMVVGSSLQAGFENLQDPASPLWTALHRLLDSHNPHALAVLVHNRSDRLMPPSDGSFVVSRRISGDDFFMPTRTGDSSDFEISVFHRRSSGEKTIN